MIDTEMNAITNAKAIYYPLKYSKEKRKNFKSEMSHFIGHPFAPLLFCGAGSER